MKRPMIIMLIILGALFGIIFGYKILMEIMTKRFLNSMVATSTSTVSTTNVKVTEWQARVKAVGSLRAVKGVNVTTEQEGLVQTISFTPGTSVHEGDILVELNADVEKGQLASLQAQATLAKITFDRDTAQYAIRAVSKQSVDSDLQNWRSLQGQVAQQEATVQKKIIRAPFTGKIGINKVNPGQYLNAGDTIASLQTMDPIYVDFNIPQQQLADIKKGQTVSVNTDANPPVGGKGVITTIDPAIDQTTRNVLIEATLPNPKGDLTPGMFVNTEVVVGTPKKYLTLPQMAIAYNSYGDIVYVLTPTNDKKDKDPIYIANQRFVVVGETRGDQVQILKGLKNNQLVVTSGQMKLHNGSRVTINNKIPVADKADPTVLEPDQQG